MSAALAPVQAPAGRRRHLPPRVRRRGGPPALRRGAGAAGNAAGRRHAPAFGRGAAPSRGVGDRRQHEEHGGDPVRRSAKRKSDRAETPLILPLSRNAVCRCADDRTPAASLSDLPSCWAAARATMTLLV